MAMRCYVATFAVIVLGCSSAADPGRSDDDLIGGRAAGVRFPAAVRLILPIGARCGAAKIGARRFLTASHCITQGGVAVGRTLAIIGGVPEGRTLAKVTRELHSAFNANAETQPPARTGPELSSQVRLDAAIFEVDTDTPAVAVARLDRTPLRAGDKVIVSGAGCNSDPHIREQTPTDLVPDALRYTEVSIASVEKYHYFLPREDVDGNEGRVCQGDSGTPLYKADASGTYTTIVGINSFRAPRLDPPVWGAATRIDRHVPDDAEGWFADAGLFSNP